MLLSHQSTTAFLSILLLVCLAGCKLETPGCESGTGTLSIMNQSGAPILINADPTIESNPIRVEGASQAIIAELGTYQLTATQESNGAELLSGSFGVACDTETVVTVTALPTQSNNLILNVISEDGAGSGQVVVTSMNGAESPCTDTCSQTYEETVMVTLKADPNPRSVFNGFTGSCAGLGVCMLSMQSARDVTAKFSKANTIRLTGMNGHVCALVNNRLRCWGENDTGQIGDGGIENQTTPTYVQHLNAWESSKVVMATAGYGFSCAVIETTVNGEVTKCWGANYNGQLGLELPGYARYSTSPLELEELVSSPDDKINSISVGLDHGCAVVNGRAKCWGTNLRGVLGVPDLVGYISHPTTVTDLTSDVTEIKVGNRHSCVKQSGGLKCWGSNDYNQLGTSFPALEFNEHAETVRYFDGGGFGTVIGDFAIGRRHTCAIKNGAAYCWGDNRDGQLGRPNDGPSTPDYDPVLMRSSAPLLVPGLEADVTAIAAAEFHSCAIQNGEVKCWGRNNNGALGRPDMQNGAINTTLAPVQDLPRGATSLVVGSRYFGCAVVNEGVYCWGDNNNGQLGIGPSLGFYGARQVATFNSGTSCTGPGKVTVTNNTGSCITFTFDKAGAPGTGISQCEATHTYDLDPAIYTYQATAGSPGSPPLAEGMFTTNCDAPQTLVVNAPACGPGTIDVMKNTWLGPQPAPGTCFAISLFDSADVQVSTTKTTCAHPDYNDVSFTGLAEGQYRVIVYNVNDLATPIASVLTMTSCDPTQHAIVMF